MMATDQQLDLFHENVDDFLRHIFGDDYGSAWVTGFKHDPASSSADGRVQAFAWGGAPYEVNRDRIRPDSNNYLCISTFRVGEDGRARRRTALMKATYALMIDDVGEKVPVERIALPPTFKIQTSPKSQQYWYVLANPVSDTAQVRAVIDNLIAAGLMSDNRDPGMRGVNRYGRLPFGLNTKAKYKGHDGSFPVVRLVEPPNWKLKPTLEVFAAAFGISCQAPAPVDVGAAPQRDEALRFNVALLDALRAEELYKEDRGGGKHEVTCPWVGEHTNAVDNGAAVFEAGYIDRSTGEVYQLGGFKCHHGHGEDIALRDVIRFLRGRGHTIPTLLPARADASTEFAAAPPVPVPDEELLELPAKKAPRKPRIVIGDYEPTDVANAARMMKLADGRLYWHADYNKWVCFDGVVWRVDNNETGVAALAHAVATYVAGLADEAAHGGQPEVAKALTKWALASRQHSKMEAMIRELKRLPEMTVRVSDFDQDPLLLGVANGVVDLRTGRLLPPDPRIRVLSNTGVPFWPGAEAPDWEPFLRAIFATQEGAEDPALYGYVRRFLGFCLTGLRQPEMFSILHGDGSNGKSTLLGVLASAMGDYVRWVDPSMFETASINKGSSNATPDLAVLPGARMVLTSESERGSRLNLKLMKQMTGDKITARQLYGTPFTFVPTFKIVMCTNELPIITGTDNGTWRRVYPVPFDRQWRYAGDRSMPQHWPVADLMLSTRLSQQLPGVLAWLVSAAGDFIRDGFGGDLPTRVEASRHKYRDDSDVFQQWLDDCVRKEEGARGFGLYDSYRRWCNENGLHSMSAPLWKREMVRKFGESKRLHGRMFFRGIVLNEFDASGAPSTDGVPS